MPSAKALFAGPWIRAASMPPAARAQLAHQIAGVTQQAEARDIERHRLGRALQQRGEAGARSGEPFEDAGRRQGQAFQAGSGDVVLVQRLARQAEPGRMPGRTLVPAKTDGHRIGAIAEHLARQQPQPPGLEQRREVGRLVAIQRSGEIAAAVGLAEGVDERQQLAPAQDELVDGV